MADEKDQELIGVVALLAHGFEIEGVQLLDAVTSEPVNLRELVGLPKDYCFQVPAYANTEYPVKSQEEYLVQMGYSSLDEFLKDAENVFVGEFKVESADDGTFTHTFKFQ